MGKLIKEKQLEVEYSVSFGEVGNACMSKVESADCCKYYSEQSYRTLILISLVRKFPFLAILGRDWPLLATIGLEDPVTD